MDAEHQLLGLLAAIIAFALVSKRLTKRWLTMPIVFTGLGLLGGTAGMGWITIDPDMELVRLLAEATLVLVLFADASRIELRALRNETGLPARLLGFGMPLTVLLGTGCAALLFPDWSLWEAALVAAILAPTDAALGQAVVSSPSVPLHIRQALNVESGLNDGIALPIVLVLIALASNAGGSSSEWVEFWAMQVVLGPVVGALLGGSLGSLLRRAQEARWSESDLSAIAGLCVAALCYLGAEAVGGNGFMAAFVGGMAFGATAGAACEGVHQFLEREGELMMIVVFMLLGCALAGPALALATHAVIAYALLSLTIVRLLPVGLSLLGTETSTATKLFLGWFGPRGLASILFGMLLLEEHELPHGEQVFAVVVITVLGSVFLHGGSAAWGSERYGTLMNTDDDATPP